MSTEMHNHRKILTIQEFLSDAIDMHLPPNSSGEEKQIDFLGTLFSQLPDAVHDTRTDTCCGQSVIFKISQIYPLITVWRNYTVLTDALVKEIKTMYGITGD